MPKTQREIDRDRTERNKKNGLVKVYGYWVHKTQRERVLKKINELIYTEDFRKPLKSK